MESQWVHDTNPPVHVNGNLKRKRDIYQILKPVRVSYLRGGGEVIFQQDNAGPHFGCRLMNYLDTEGVRLLSWADALQISYSLKLPSRGFRERVDTPLPSLRLMKYGIDL